MNPDVLSGGKCNRRQGWGMPGKIGDSVFLDKIKLGPCDKRSMMFI
jgi:hypothetical protein